MLMKLLAKCEVRNLGHNLILDADRIAELTVAWIVFSRVLAHILFDSELIYPGYVIFYELWNNSGRCTSLNKRSIG